MGRLLDKIKQSNSRPGLGNVTSRVYAEALHETIGQGLQERLMEEATAVVKNKLLSAQKETEEARAETVRVKAEYEAQVRALKSTQQQTEKGSESAIEEMKSEIARLSNELTNARSVHENSQMETDVLSSTLKGQVMEYDQSIESLEQERENLMEARREAQTAMENYALERDALIEAHSLKTQSLREEIEAAESAAEAARNRPPPDPIIVKTPPPPIPDFELIPTRGHNDRVVSVIVRPDADSGMDDFELIPTRGFENRIISAAVKAVGND